MVAHENAVELPQRELLSLLETVKHKADQTELRSWKLALAVVAIAVASGFGAQLVRRLLGG